MGSMLDQVFKGIAENFLVTDVKLFDTNSGTYVGWGVFRTIANVAFVIVFLVIIFSQLTSAGITNYGVKKMLPRIVVAAILVNISFFVCQLAVDLSNILGSSLKSIFDGIANTASVPTSTDASANGFGIVAIIAGVLGAGVISYFALSILIPVLIGALISVLMIILILILRKALIVLLIVISPLAFVAFLLPNTESLFTKWRKAFVAILLVFPIVAVVFGAASLASQILLGTDPGNVSIQIAAVGAASLPFFIVPGLLKGSLDAIGNVGGKISGFGSKLGGNAGKGFANTRAGKGLAYLDSERKQRNALMQAGVFDEKYKRFDPRRIRNLRNSVNSGLNRVSGGFGTRLAAGGVAESSKESATEIAAADSLMEHVNLSSAQRQSIARGETITHGGMAFKGSDIATRKAAISRQSNGSHADISELVNMGLDGDLGRHLARSMASSSSRPTWLGQGALEEIANGTAKDQGYDADYYIGDKDELVEVLRVASSSLVAPADTAKLGANARAIDGDTRLQAQVSKNAAEVSSLKGL
jgi:hypothetical protein